MNKLLLVAAVIAALTTGCSRTPDPLKSVDGACANYFKSQVGNGVILAVDDRSSGDHCSALLTFDAGRDVIYVAEASGIINRFSDDKFTVVLQDDLSIQSYFSSKELSEELRSVAWSQWLKSPKFANCEETWTKVAEGKERLDNDKCHNVPYSVLMRLQEGNQKRLANVMPITTAKACEQLGDSLKGEETVYVSVKQSGEESCSAVTIESKKSTPNNALETQLTFNLNRIDPETVEIERNPQGSRAFTIISEKPYLFDQRIPDNFSVEAVTQNLSSLQAASEGMSIIKDTYKATFFPNPNAEFPEHTIEENIVNFTHPALTHIMDSNMETMTMLSQLPPGLLDNNLAKRWIKLMPTLKQEVSAVFGTDRPDQALRQVGHDRFNRLMSLFEECLSIEASLKDKVENRITYQIQADKGPLKGQKPHKQVITPDTDITNT